MNKLTGKIMAIETSPHMSMVDIDVDGDVFCSIVLETPATAVYLKQGHRISVLFKETEVSIGKNLSGLISLRNNFKGTVKRLEKSAILTKVFLNYKNKEVVSIISTRSAQKLSLTEGDEVRWLVKTNEVSLFDEA
jgi:molybdate transport system regulatory protein